MTNINTIEISGEITGETDLAVFFTDGITEACLPKSQIEIEPEFYKFNELVEIEISE